MGGNRDMVWAFFPNEEKQLGAFFISSLHKKGSREKKKSKKDYVLRVFNFLVDFFFVCVLTSRNLMESFCTNWNLILIWMKKKFPHPPYGSEQMVGNFHKITDEFLHSPFWWNQYFPYIHIHLSFSCPLIANHQIWNQLNACTAENLTANFHVCNIFC